MNTDIRLQHDILNKLARDPGINPAEIAVAVKDGIVTLTGHVQRTHEKWTAGCLARGTSGVTAVANQIVIGHPEGHLRTDSDIARTAVAALGWDLQVPPGRVDVMVSDGWITLQGRVDWDYQKEAAESSVSNLTGVKGVTNVITVTPRLTSKEVRSGIGTTFAHNTEYGGEYITEETPAGRLVLRGQVTPWADRERARREILSPPEASPLPDRVKVGV